MTESAFLALLEEEGTEVVELCSGTIADGRAFHAFIQMTVANRQRYHRDLAARTPLDLPSYGQVLHTGWGREPDATVTQAITENCTDNVKLLEAIGRHAVALQDIVRHNSHSSTRA